MSERAIVHSPHAHQFETLAQQHEAATLGMWVFLATEVLFFGGMFAAYAVYRYWYTADFGIASRHLDLILGGVNTAVLLTSSLTMALAVRATQLGNRRATTALLSLTLLFGTVFLGVKGVEYWHKYEEHLIPGSGFVFEGGARHAEIFFSLYFAMTSMHALHMIIGIGMLGTLIFMNVRRRFTASYYFPVEMGGLYWHFVDIVWVFLFPLLYLVHRV